MRQLLLSLSIIVTPFTAIAQGGGTGNPGTPVEVNRCGIWYDYDNNGNRIKRYYDCKDMTPTPYPEGPTSLDGPVVLKQGRTDSTTSINDVVKAGISVFPNPTTDRFTIKLPKTGTHTHFHIYDAKGAIITSGHIDGDIYSGGIGMLPPANYVFVVYYEEKPYRFTITKL